MANSALLVLLFGLISLLACSQAFVIDDSDLQDVETMEMDDGYRVRRQAGQNAMDRALTNNPVGKPDFSGHNYGTYYQDPKNFGGRVGGSVGMKVFESGPHSVGVGAGLDVNAGVNGGRPFVNNPNVGVGAGYRFRFRRDIPIPEEQNDDDMQSDVVYRERRQAGQNAMNKALTNNPVGKPDFGGRNYGTYYQDKKNFGGRFGGSVGVKVYDNGRHSVGVGAGVDANAGMNRGKPYVNRPDYGVGVGYKYRFGRSLF